MTEKGNFNQAPSNEYQPGKMDKRLGYSPSMMEAFSTGLTELVQRGIIPPQSIDTYSQPRNTTEIRAESTATNAYDKPAQGDEHKPSAA